MPPEGTQLGDSHRRIAGSEEFFSTTGESRGHADMYVLSRRHGNKLIGRVRVPLAG